MKILEVRIEFPDTVDDHALVEYGEHLQATLPADFGEDNVGDVTFQVITPDIDREWQG